MTCIKTGARVHFENYGQTLVADIFQVANAVVVRTHPDRLSNPDPYPVTSPTHTLIAPPGGENEFWRDDLGVFVVPATCLKEL